MRHLALALSFIIGSSSILPAQSLHYEGTTFIHGYNDGPERFTRKNTAYHLGQDLLLKDVSTPLVYGKESIRTQSFYLAEDLAGRPGPRVLIGHSMGGLVARDHAGRYPAGVAAIITVGTPHNGAPIAANGRAFRPYVYETYNRLMNAATQFAHRDRILGVLTLELASLWPNKMIGRLIEEQTAATPAVLDIMPGSSEIARLRAQVDALPRAYVVGILHKRDAALKTLVSAEFQDHNMNYYIGLRYLVTTATGMCAGLGLFAIVRADRAMVCAFTHRRLNDFDDAWRRQTNGPNIHQAFDGLVREQDAVYPHTPDLRAKQEARGANHNNLVYDQRGLTAIVGAGRWVGMPYTP